MDMYSDDNGSLLEMSRQEACLVKPSEVHCQVQQEVLRLKILVSREPKRIKRSKAGSMRQADAPYLGQAALMLSDTKLPTALS